MVHANGSGGDTSRFDAKFPEDILTHRVAAFSTEPPYTVFGIVSGKSGQVDAGNSLEQPSGLIGFFDRSSAWQRLTSSFNGRGVGLHGSRPVKIELDAWVSG